MAFGRTKQASITASAAPRGQVRSLVASAMQVSMDNTGYNAFRMRDQTWQRELWRLYDIVPEFRFAAGWVGSCCSRVEIYVAEVDKLGRVQGRAKKDKIAALSDSVFGNPASKAEALRSCGINLTVAGECFILGEAGNDDNGGRDRWFVLSSSEIRRTKNGNIYWGDKLGQQIVDAANQMITRVWTPHPERIMQADSPARSCQPILRELEQLTKYVFSQIDSRLAGAGVFIIPNNLDFPIGDDASTVGESLMIRLAEAMAQSLKGEGQALALVPLILEAAPEDIDRGFKYITFASELSKQAAELRGEAIGRLGMGMDMAPEVLSGMGEATNHWSAWHVEESSVKIHIEPLMNRICAALTSAYLIPALKVMGEDPARYIYAFDTAPLTVRPQRFTDAMNLWDKDIIGDDAVLDAGFFKESDKPTPEESAKKFVRDVVLRDPQLFSIAKVRELCGIDEEMLPQDQIAPMAVGQNSSAGMPGIGPSGPPPPPTPPTGIQTTIPTPLPGDNGQPPAAISPSSGPSGAPPSLTAAAVERDQLRTLTLVVTAEATVRRMLELAGGRLLDRHNRERWPDIPRHELHTRIKVQDNAHAKRLLQGAWDHLPALTAMLGPDVVDPNKLGDVLSRYCSILMTNATAHEPKLLISMLTSEGLLDG